MARQVFRRLARQGRLSSFGFAEDDWSAQSSRIPASTLSPVPSGSDLFRLWGDDFRAGNILLTDSDDIAALIDWEFACDTLKDLKAREYSKTVRYYNEHCF